MNENEKRRLILEISKHSKTKLRLEKYAMEDDVGETRKLLAEIDTRIKQSRARLTVITLMQLSYKGIALEKMYHDITGEEIPRRYRNL